MTTTRKLWIGLLILAVLSPLGLLVPHWLHGGPAWGEADWDQVEKQPSLLHRVSGYWQAPLPNYSSSGAEHSGLAAQSLWYALSAFCGLALVVGLSLLLGRWLAKNERAADVDN